MNLEKLRLAEAQFLEMYPGGFDHPEMVKVGKKHGIDRMTTFAAEVFARSQFRNTHTFLENLIKLVSRSSMVSMFEKPKFRDAVNGLDADQRSALVRGYRKLMHGNQEKGFNEILGILAPAKVAKWSLMTIGLVYFRPQTEVFVKPTTAKGIIQLLELDDLIYRPRPSWEFYMAYRSAIMDMKTEVSSSLSPNNAAFTGFLMMSL